MAEERRTCTRTGCRRPAAASLSYRYDSRQAWLLDLPPSPDPARYDLCPHHADTVTVPRGWQRVDERTPPPAVVAPSTHNRAVSRYAPLVAELPRLAAQLPPHPAGRAVDPLGPAPQDDQARGPGDQLALPLHRRAVSGANPIG